MSIFGFYILAYTYSWILWILGIVFLKDILNPYLIVSIGGLAPVISFLAYFIFEYNTKQKYEYLSRLIKFKKNSMLCWITALIVPFLIIIISIIIDGIFFSTEFSISNIIKLDQEFINKGLVYPVFLLAFGPVPEEMAWRGIALNELIKKGYLKAQLIVALLWALWHFPLFFIEGSYQAGLGLFTIEFWMFFINIFFISLITGWIYLKSNKSILLAIIFHYIINLSGEMFYITTTGEILVTIFTCLLGIVLFIQPILSKKSIDCSIKI
mgnify:CR=1 FL=1